MSVVFKHINDPIPNVQQFNPQLPDSISEIITKAMAKVPAERYQSANEMARDLRKALASSRAASLALNLPSDLLIDKPTPIESDSTPTDIGPAMGDQTELLTPAELITGAKIGDRTAIYDTPLPDSATVVQPEDMAVKRAAKARNAPPVMAKKKKRPWVLGLFLILLIGGGLFGLQMMQGGNFSLSGTAVLKPTEVTIAPTKTATKIPTETPIPTITLTPAPTADVIATNAAAVFSTLTAAAPLPATATLTPSPTVKPTQTPNVAATALAACQYDVTLNNVYSYSDPRYNVAPVGATFPMQFVLENSGDCNWTPEMGLQLIHLDGETFSNGDPLPLALSEEVAPGEEMTFKATFVAPSRWAVFNSSWQLETGANEKVGEPLAVKLTTYVPQTATPQSSAPTATPTPVSGGEVTQLDFNLSYNNCEYAGGDWRCLMTIMPYGGGGGPYTIWIFDSEPAARYYTPGNEVHFIQSRRCFAWVHEIKLQDDPSGMSITKNIYVDPQVVLPGGCTE